MDVDAKVTEGSGQLAKIVQEGKIFLRVLFSGDIKNIKLLQVDSTLSKYVLMCDVRTVMHYFSTNASFLSISGYLLGFFRHEKDQLKVVRPQRHVKQLVYVYQQQQELQSFIRKLWFFA